MIGHSLSGSSRPARPAQLEESLARYLAEFDRADREPALVLEARAAHFNHKIRDVRAQMRRLNDIGERLRQSEEKQVCLTDPDARRMASRGCDTRTIGYNVQTAVDMQQHLIVTREVTRRSVVKI